MALQVQIGHLCDPGKWDKFVRSREGSNLFQESKWLSLLEKDQFLEPCHIQLSRNGNILCAFPNFRKMKWRSIWQAESLPIGYGGPVCSKHPEEIFNALQAIINKKDKSARQIIRIYGEEGFGLSGVFYEWGFFPMMVDCLPTIDLSLGIESVIEAISPANKRDLRRAERFSLDVREIPCRDADMGSFYNLYRSTMENLKVTSIKEFPFFKDLCNIFREESSLMAAYADGTMVAARLHLKDSHRSRIHYLFSANSPEGKRCLAGSILHKHSLQWALDKGYKIYDMGSTLADVRDALYKYKVKWGARIQIAPQWVRIKRPLIFNSLKFVKSLFQRP